jgi:hypothetical protein
MPRRFRAFTWATAIGLFLAQKTTRPFGIAVAALHVMTLAVE